VCWCEVRQLYGCAEYEPAENQLLVSQTNDSVLLRCAQGSNTARTWTLSCVDGQWTTNDDQTVDCRSNLLVKTPDSSQDTSAGHENKGTLRYATPVKLKGVL